MQTQDFKLFLEVAEAGSFTKVAAQRQTVQSHISRQVAELERQCGSALFRRTGRGVALTEFGSHVAQRVRMWLQDSEALFSDIRHTAQVPMGAVRLGLLPSAAHPLMTQVFKRLQREYPHITLNVREGQGGELDAMLDAGSVVS
jgi:DNA-binding transcriptional LysR family regulator